MKLRQAKSQLHSFAKKVLGRLRPVSINWVIILRNDIIFHPSNDIKRTKFTWKTVFLHLSHTTLNQAFHCTMGQAIKGMRQ